VAEEPPRLVETGAPPRGNPLREEERLDGLIQGMTIGFFCGLRVGRNG